MALQFIDNVADSQIKDKKVLIRFDFNVPLNKETKEINDSTRIDNALNTIKLLLDKGASKIIMMSHLGRPKGQVNPDFSLEPVATYLADKLGEEVTLTESCLDRGIKTLLTLNSNKIILLENLRFHKEETENDREFARKLSEYADLYINDAFGAAHRKHASTYAINAFFKNKAYAGLLMKKEIEALSKITERPEAPFVAVVGGAKVSDKIKIIERLLSSVSNLLIGGAMAYPFLKAKGNEVGTSLCSDEDVSLAKKIFSQSTAHKIVLPTDHIVSSEFGGSPESIDKVGIPADKMGLDIGEQTIAQYSSILKGAKTILWNGPMGIFENEDYSKGTFAIAEVLSETDAYTLVGGGDSVSAVNKSGLADKMSHVSTGGGASLEFIEKGSLPGISALKFGVE